MAELELPPILEKVYELNRWLLRKVGTFPKDRRFLLGQRLVNKSLDIQDGLLKAALMKKTEAKAAVLREVSLQLEQLRYLVRLAKDEKDMNRRSWYFCSKKLLEIGKMLGGWIKTV